MTSSGTSNDRFAHFPVIPSPSVIQAPYQIPPLYSFSRTTVYLLLGPETYYTTPEALVLRATCSDGPLELEIKIEDVGKAETIHQLAAKKAVSELETSGGWLSAATDKLDSTLLKDKYRGRWEDIVEREAVRLGVQYQIAGKWTSFVALEGNNEHEAIILGAEPSLLLNPVIESHDMLKDISEFNTRSSAAPMQHMQAQCIQAQYMQIASPFRADNMFKRARYMKSRATAIFNKENDGEVVEQAGECPPAMAPQATGMARRRITRDFEGDSDYPPVLEV